MTVMKDQLKQFSFLTALLLMFLSETEGQQLSTYNLQHLPQRSYMNPSFAPHGKINIGIPVLSGVSHSYTNNGFTYSDLFKRTENNILILDISSALEELKSRNYLSMHAETEIISFGIKAAKNYFSLNITEKADVNFTFSKSLMEFLYEGNAATAGTVQQLNPGLEGIHYREYGISWSREISSLITAGIRVKYLYGMEHTITKGTGITIYTNPEDFSITANTDYTIYTSGLDTNSFKNLEISKYAFNKRNKGYAIDAGVTMRPLKSVEITASVIDFGSIKWSTDNVVYHTNTQKEGFIYSGINLDEFVNNENLDAETYLQSIGDSLYESLNISETSESYTYKMPVQFYFSTSYLISPRYKITALARNKNTYHENHTDYQFSFTGKSKNWLNYTVSLNKLNKTKATPGLGFSINFHNDQIYFVTDNIPGLFNWKNSYSTGFRAGINIMFGTKLKYMKPPQPVLEEVSSTTP